MDIGDIKKIHFIGIGGIGMSALAKMMVVSDKEVSGSDLVENQFTEELANMGATIYNDQIFEQVPEDVDLIVYSSAVPEDNPERARAQELNVDQLTYFEFLGAVSRDKFTIAVSGTHGKSTTTAMLGKILIEAGLDPTIIVGSSLKDFSHGNYHHGNSKYFLVEACEYKANFLNLDPNILIITNIEAEHLDFYKDLEDVAAAFQRLNDKLPKDGLLIYNADDYASTEIIRPQTESMNFSISKEATFEAKDIDIKPGKLEYNVAKDGEEFIKQCELVVPGKFNVANSLAAIACADHLGADKEKIKKALQDFKGLWRRIEVVGEYEGATIISDYGHHPTEIIASTEAIKEFYPENRLVWVFQPHHHNRTKELFEDFTKSFGGVDVLLVSDIYDVAGREETEDQDINSQKLANAISDISPNIKVKYTGDLNDTKRAVIYEMKPGDVVVFQGAGDIDDVARKII